MPVLRRNQQRSPSIMRALVHIGARLHQKPGAFQTVFAGREHQWSEATAIGFLCEGGGRLEILTGRLWRSNFFLAENAETGVQPLGHGVGEVVAGVAGVAVGGGADVGSVL